MEKNHLTGAQKLEELYEAKLEYDADKKAELEANYRAQIESLEDEKREERKNWEFKVNELMKEADDKLAEQNKETELTNKFAETMKEASKNDKEEILELRKRLHSVQALKLIKTEKI
jgi:hypothetical protein